MKQEKFFIYCHICGEMVSISKFDTFLKPDPTNQSEHAIEQYYNAVLSNITHPWCSNLNNEERIEAFGVWMRKAFKTVKTANLDDLLKRFEEEMAEKTERFDNSNTGDTPDV